MCNNSSRVGLDRRTVGAGAGSYKTSPWGIPCAGSAVRHDSHDALNIGLALLIFTINSVLTENLST